MEDYATIWVEYNPDLSHNPKFVIVSNINKLLTCKMRLIDLFLKPKCLRGASFGSNISLFWSTKIWLRDQQFVTLNKMLFASDDMI
jgi:hypothetical protein